MIDRDNPAESISLITSAMAMVSGLGILFSQIVRTAFVAAGWTGVGFALVLIAVLLFGFNVWMTDIDVPRYPHGR